ncbi:hypothetical protein ACFLT4_02715 [Chloroflexota bacterium]
MMLRRNLGKWKPGAIICVIALFTIIPSVFAAEPHENPETAGQVFSGISLLNYYSASLDFVLQKNPAEVESRLEKMPFANIPRSLEESTDDFATSSISISHMVVAIDENLSEFKILIEQFRLSEAIGLAIQISDNLSQANSELKSIEQATVNTGEELKVFSAPAGSDLRRSYDELLERIERIREMLDLYRDLLVDLMPKSEKINKLLESIGIQLEELMGNAELAVVKTPRPVDIALEELIGSTEIALIKTLTPRGTSLGELLESLNIRVEEFLELENIAVFEELIPTDVTLANLLKSADITIVKTLKLRDITPEELITSADFILVEPLEPTDTTQIELLGPAYFTMIEGLDSVDISLEVQPTIAFVGDKLSFKGLLTSRGKPLSGREVDILLNNSRYVSVKTDTYGRYQGILQVPYWYIPELDVQALYYPQNKDIGTYLASLSPVTKVEILFYKVELEITVDDKAYPGLETTVSGRFDYSEYPPLKERKAEIYIDDVFVNEITVQEAFTQKIEIDPAVGVGKHVVTVSVAAVERYSSVVASVILNVTRATTILDLNIPNIAIIPGSVGLVGRLYSEVGPLSEAPIKMGLGKSRVELVSSKDGTFNTRIKVGMGVGLIGSEDLIIQVLPQQPWDAPLNSTSSILMVNIINIGGILAILIILGIYLPSMLRGRLGVYTRRRVRPEMQTAPPELTPVYSERVTALTVTEESKEILGEPRGIIFYWYRLIVRYLQGITKVLLGPQQTLREFARGTSGLLGSASKYFVELTTMVEKLLYSQYKPLENDVENSKRLSNTIEEETKLRVTVQSTQPRGDEIRAPFGYSTVSLAGETSSFELGGRDFTTSVWKQLSTWLFILLVLTVLYYACILLLILPLLIVSFALCPPLVMIDDSRKGEPRQ